MKIVAFPKRVEWPALLARPSSGSEEVEAQVVEILSQVKRRGDEAIRDYSLKYENRSPTDLEIRREEIDHAADSLDADLRSAIDAAYENIRKFHLNQKKEETKIEISPGVVCWRKSVPIQKVGLYVPGGTAPLFSTVLMLGVPAQIAGCEEITLCTPSDHSAILYAARKVGVHRIFRVGGAQAIAAMAFGTASIPKVFKIFGPGNSFVMRAKMLVNKEGTAIDMPAGPSELAIYADETATPSFVIADLLSQAEHGPDSQVLLVSTNKKLLSTVNLALTTQLEALPRRDIARKSIENSLAILAENENEAMDIMNEYAPEHLILNCKNKDILAEKVINAGSVFLGNYSPESCGDYASGTNHTLPTNAYAKAYSGVSVESFEKKITFQEITPKGLKSLAPIVEKMAEAEGLMAHKRAITVRINSLASE